MIGLRSSRREEPQQQTRLPMRARFPFSQNPEGELRARTQSFAASGSLSARLKSFRRLFRAVWKVPSEHTFHRRLMLWIHILEQEPDLRAEFQSSLALMLEALDFVPLFTETGLPTRHAVFSEGLRRVVQRFMPASRPEEDAARLLGALFATRRDVERYLELSDPLYERLRAVLGPGGTEALPATTPVEAAAEPDDPGAIQLGLREALRLLAARVAGRTLGSALRSRGSGSRVQESPFYRLLFATEDFLNSSSSQKALATWRAAVSACREELDVIHLKMESTGVSSDLMLDLRSAERTLSRMDRLASVVDHGRTSEPAVHRLFQELVRGRLEDRSLSSLLRQDLNLLARKTVEHTARSGEHYIARNRSEYWAMWLAGLGGGLLTVLTAAGKMAVYHGHYPLFVEGFLNSVDYAVSFVLLQVFGLALATKQPSATGASFAEIVRANRGTARLKKISDFTARITRTQLAAAIANVAAVSGGAVAFEWLWRLIFSQSYLPTTSARHVYETLHPLNSGTIFFAAGTGILLWLAAVIGGWFENFAAYHRITAAVAQHPLGERVGEYSMSRAAAWLEYNLAGWSTSIALGFLLGFAPDIAGFFGIPFEVRHVTLTTGTLALAVAHFGVGAFEHNWFYAAAAGIGVCFVLNLGVSFCIAAFVALRAYDVRTREQLRLVRFLLLEILRAPWRFVLPVNGR